LRERIISKVTNISLLGKFSLVSLFLLAMLGVMLAWGLSEVLTSNALRQEGESAADQVATILDPNLEPSDLAGPLPPDKFRQIDWLIRHNILRRHIVRVKIWGRDGTLLYADDPSLVGRRFPISHELAEALEGEVATELSSLQEEENVGERGRYSQLLEVYVPLRPQNSATIAGVYEIYHDTSVLEPRLAEARHFVWGSVAGVFLLLYGALFTLVRNASRQLTRQNEENARLYRQATQTIAERQQAQEKVQRQLQRLAALRSIDLAITSSLDLRVTLDVVLDKVTSQLQVDAAHVMLLDPNTQMLMHAAGRGFRNTEVVRSRMRPGEGYAGKAALERRTISITDLSTADATPRTTLFNSEGFVAYFAVPLVAKGQVKGVLEVLHRSPLAPDNEWLDFLEALAGQAAIAIDNATLFEQLQRSNLELTLAYDTTLEGWSHALELRDRETEGHTRRVADITVRLARAMGMSDAELVHVYRGALLHDIGKMAIPDSILLKPGPLTDEEAATMRQHPTYAYELLSPISFLQPALDIPYCHHEWWDGSGYPRGLKGDQIPLSARIFTIVDVWDALRSDRPYRQAWPEERVIEHIKSLSGRQFDPAVVETFFKLLPSLIHMQTGDLYPSSRELVTTGRLKAEA
jgi:putative nucleotidyltransferase with HDIG domain